ncbi:MAG: hypothetical protein OEM29_00970 [Thermoplasmata archaeon]|nr:hypothetical protein [Thermoplasmata archaeon]
MVSCYDCDHFGTRCRGILPPMKYRDTIDEYCENYKVVEWRRELYKPGGETRI